MELETTAEERAKWARLAGSGGIYQRLARDIDRLLAERAAPPAIPESAMEELYRTGSAMVHTHVPGEAWRAPEPAPLPAEVEKMRTVLLQLAEWEQFVGLSIPDDLREAAAILSRWPKEAGWQPISTAPKDGTKVLLQMKQHFIDYRRDLDAFRGIQFVGRNVAASGMDWTFAGPVGCGGFPDEWIAGWMPLPPAPKEEK